MKIIFLCDFFIEDILGGGEICNECVINYLNKNHEVKKVKTHNLSIKQITDYRDYFFVIGNFTFLDKQVLDYITSNINYVIYEHDYKLIKNRNPARYVNFLAPKEDIVYFDFYKNAKKIICQSNFQKSIIDKNLNLDNTVSLGTNFWLDEHYDLLENISLENKNSKYAIIDYAIEHKNTIGSIQYCKKNNLDFELIKDNNYINFLKKLGKYKGFIFFPKTPETFSRTCAESRMMGLEIHSNNLIGCIKEEWFSKYKGKDLIDFMKNKNKEAYKYFEDLL